MRLFKKDNIDDYIIPKGLSIGATGMLNSLLELMMNLKILTSTLSVMTVEKILH